VSGALSLDPANSPWQRCLDGEWKFCYAANPGELPAGFEDDDFDAAGWNDISVPGNWMMQGYDKPIYCNVKMPIPNTPPFCPPG